MNTGAVHAALLKAYSPMPLAVAYTKPLQRWKQPVAHLSAAMGSLHAIQSTLAYLTTSAAVSWASLWCIMLLLHGKGVLETWGSPPCPWCANKDKHTSVAVPTLVLNALKA